MLSVCGTSVVSARRLAVRSRKSSRRLLREHVANLALQRTVVGLRLHLERGDDIVFDVADGHVSHSEPQRE